MVTRRQTLTATLPDMLEKLLSSSLLQLFVAFTLLILAAGYLILIYNHLVRLQRNIEKAWSNIEVLLKQRHSELSKLIVTCQEHMQYEKETLVAITQARSDSQAARQQLNVAAVGKAEGMLRRRTKELIALAESYPSLKANASFVQLEKRVAELEQTIADRRLFYNETVTQYNTRIQSIPDVWLAKSLGYRKVAVLEISTTESSDVSIKQEYQRP